jgi:subtilisin family serine protease
MDAAPGGTDPDAVWDAIRAALRRPEVEFAEPDAVFELPIPPDVDAFVAPPGPTPTLGDVDPTWHLNAIHAPDAWEMFAAKGKLPGAGVRIAHLDTGVTDHPAVPLPPRLLNGYDFWDGVPGAKDPMPAGIALMPGHGTGTICLLAADSLGPPPYRGVAWGSEVLPIRISPSVILVWSEAFVRGLFHAIEHGSHVATISMGGLPSKLWAEAVNAAYEHGIVVCAAAGNNFGSGWLRTPSHVVYPAKFERVFAISGITKSETRYRFNSGMSGNDGPEVDVSAPTPDVLWARAEPGKPYYYGLGGGTSTATPQVAGAAALWLSYWADDLAGYSPIERVDACRLALLVGAEDAGTDPYWPVPNAIPPRTRNDFFGDGRLDIARTLAFNPTKGLTPTPPDDVPLLSTILPSFGLNAQTDPSDVASQIELLWGVALMDQSKPLHEAMSGIVSSKLQQRLF